MKELRDEAGMKKTSTTDESNWKQKKMEGGCTKEGEDRRQHEHWKQKSVANDEEAETKTETAQHKTRPGER